jgi:cellulose synthase/poly-beta-1,6-N-acetylglucosamine synthase-like glycosyltransferase
MQENGYKIDQCPDAYVYTSTPKTITKLYKQRLRWIYGFIKNLIDYRRLLFKKKYGTVALFTLPSGIVGVIGVVFLFVNVSYNIIRFLRLKIIEIQTIGWENLFNFGGLNFDWFFLSTKAVLFFSLTMYILIVISLLIGRKLAENKTGFPVSIFYYFIIYSVVAPFWMLRALFNAIISKESSWTAERKVEVK